MSATPSTRVLLNFARWGLTRLAEIEGLAKFGTAVNQSTETVTLWADVEVNGRHVFNVFAVETLTGGERGFEARAFGFFAALGAMAKGTTVDYGPDYDQVGQGALCETCGQACWQHKLAGVEVDGIRLRKLCNGRLVKL